MLTGTIMRYKWIWAAIGGLALASAALAADAGSGPAIAGRWDISITQGEHQAPSWIGICAQKDGKLEAQFLGTGGGVHPIDAPTFEQDTLTFKVGDNLFTGKLTGDTLEGVCKKGNAQSKWVAHRYVPKINVTGRWSLAAGDKKTVLNIKQEGSTVTGRWAQGRRNRMDISQGKVVGNTLTFMAGEEMYAFEVKGDMISGKSKGGEISGTRQRKWGKPVDLLDGKPEDLKNWEPLHRKEFNWRIEEGVMTNGRNGTENIVTKRKDFQNFKLNVEFKVPPGGNSGVYLRGRYEIQVADSFDHRPEGGSCAALYSRIPPKTNPSKKPGEWQTLDITIIDNYVTVVFNGETVIDNQEIEGITGGAIDSNEADPGPIYLQGDHTQVWYRKVILTPAE